MPYWRLSGFYFFYFASLGALVFYWNPYLSALGFNDAQIGELMAIIMATRIVAPNLWGYIADASGKRMAIVRIGSFLTVFCFLGVFWAEGYWGMAIALAAFSFFWNSSLPQFEATTLNHLGKNTNEYNRIRIWGSVGFIVTVMLLGFAFDLISYLNLPLILFLLFLFIFLFSLFVPGDQVEVQQQNHNSLLKILKRPEVYSLLIVVCLLQASHGPYYVYFVRYLTLYDYSQSVIGVLIAIGVAAEIVIFLLIGPLLKQYGHRQLILYSLALTVLRWLLTAIAPASISVILMAQFLHAASFGIMHVVSIELVHRYFVGPHQGRGQALYSSMSFGLGGVIGSLYSGYLWQTWGDVSQGKILFYTALFVSLLAFIVAWRGIEKNTV